ncbi:MAG: hypothetical protein U5R31_00570 [Acidimicrobiia bacterium]|nr:hypothetical protein [Acidimicrobiia bacterium]
MLHPTEAEGEHQLEARLLGEDGELVGSLKVGFGLVPQDLRPGEELSGVFPVNLHDIQIDKPGAYSFEILVDKVHMGSVPFVAEQKENA